MSVSALLKPFITFIYQCLANYRAYYRKKQSELALSRLDEHLLNDVGLTRQQNEIVPLKSSVHHLNTVRRQRNKSRLRHAYLVRRQRYGRGRKAVN